MKKSKKFITMILSMVVLMAVLLAACQNTASKTPDESGNPANPANPSDITSGSPSEGTGNSRPGEQAQPGDKTSSSDAGTSSGQKDGAAESSKDQYLAELNKMEEADRNEAAGTTMVELEQQEAARYKKWDQKLNEIYGVLKEQLSTEQMDQLKEEQRSWVQQRDAKAKQSSLQYEGGSSEQLEYVTTQASLTRERCYALVAKYMK